MMQQGIGPVAILPWNASDRILVAMNTRPKRFLLVKALLGFSYVFTSLGFGIWFLYLISPSLANSHFWPGFNRTAHQAFLVDIANVALSTLSIPEPLSTLWMPTTYHTLEPTTTFYQSYARRLAQTKFIDLEYVIPVLRHLPITSAKNPRIQQCWVDFNKTWEVAHTSARQARCLAKYSSNGAVYYESILRNVDFNGFMAAFGGPGNEFTVAIQLGIMETSYGVAWYNATSVARLNHDIPSEIVYWKNFGITKYQYLWHNYAVTGISETITIQNTFGTENVVVVKSSPSSNAVWTTMIFFWLPGNDWSTAQHMNCSLIRGAHNDIRAFGSFESMLGIENGPNNTFLTQTGVVHFSIGEFLSIDPWLIPIPNSLIQLYTTLLITFQAKDVVLGDFYRQPAFEMIPEIWDSTKYDFYGGSPLCLYNTNTTLPQKSFSFEDDCEKVELLKIDVFPATLLYTMSIMPQTNFSKFCHNNVKCLLMVASAHDILQLYQPANISLLFSTASVDVQKLNSGFMQFATNASATWQLLFTPLDTTSNGPWGVFTWLLLFDWVLGRREIVEFDGDVSNIVLISGTSPGRTIPSGAGQIGATNTGNRIVLFLLQYVSAMLVMVAMICTIYGIHYKLNIAGQNLFYFNRLASSAWVGRPLLLLRGGCALLVLSTIPLELSSNLHITHFTWSPRPQIETALLCGEALWITYVVTDFLYMYSFAPPRTIPTWAFSVWLTLVVLSVSQPISPNLNLNPQCTSADIDGQLICTSGVITIGSFSRFLTLFVICISGAIFTMTYGYMVKSLQIRKSSMLVSALATTCLSPWYGGYDVVSGAMCGLLTIKHRIFYLKLWSFADSLIPKAPKKGIDEDALSSIWTRCFCCKMNRLVTLLAVLYIIASLLGGLLYLGMTSITLSNDMLWASFNMTSTHIFLATWFYSQHFLGRQTQVPFTLTNSSINTILTPKTIGVIPHAGNILQYSQMNTLEAVIAGFRNNPIQDTCDRPWIFTQYCFVDFKQTWEMANSPKRQTRCYGQKMTTNAAVYLEAILRNIDWLTWRFCWGDAFDIAIANYLSQSLHGQQWLTSLHAPQLSEAEESFYWAAHGLQHYTTQWQTYKTIGLISMYNVQNAYGMQYPFIMQSSNGTYTWSIATTHKLYWGFGNDLNALTTNTSGIAGKSLIRSSANFAFDNISIANVYYNTGILNSPLASNFMALFTTIGPFGSIDIYYQAPPKSLQTLLRTSIDALHTKLSQNASCNAAYSNFKSVGVMIVLPAAWRNTNASSVGGSILCPALPSLPLKLGFTSLVSRQSCPSSQYMNTISKSPYYLVLGGLLSNISMDDIPGLCKLVNGNTPLCEAFMTATLQFTTTYFADFTTNANQVLGELESLNISIVQYAHWTNQSNVWIAHAPVFDAASLPFFLWLFAYDWVFGYRDVLQVVGDTSSMTILTDHINYAEQNIDTSQLPLVMSTYARACVNYVNSGMILIALVVMVYIIYTRGHVEGLNLFTMNGIGGIVWLGRPMLLIRSMTALGVLSTSTLTLVQEKNLVHFTSMDNTRPWYTILLASSEVLWLALIANDIAMVWTHIYTTNYGFLHRSLVWVLSALLTTFSPVQSVAMMSNDCQVDQVDYQIVCTHAEIQFGNAGRLLTLIVLVLGLQIVSYCVVRWIVKYSSNDPGQDIFYYSGARYYFARSKWTYDGVEYIDPASAVLNGNISIALGQQLYILDIKFWCIKTTRRVPPDRFAAVHPFHQAAKYAISLDAADGM